MVTHEKDSSGDGIFLISGHYLFSHIVAHSRLDFFMLPLVALYQLIMIFFFSVGIVKDCVHKSIDQSAT